MAEKKTIELEVKSNIGGSISELKAFVAHGGSYAAKIGDTDDLIMASLLSVRMIQELGSYHFDLDTYVRDHEEMIAPLPFFAVIS